MKLGIFEIPEPDSFVLCLIYIITEHDNELAYLEKLKKKLPKLESEMDNILDNLDVYQIIKGYYGKENGKIVYAYKIRPHHKEQLKEEWTKNKQFIENSLKKYI